MGLTVILAIIVLRVPKLKGWKYEVNNNQYFASQENLYAQVMNTVWSGRTETYPIKSVKGEIIEGHGEMAERKERNSVRDYVVKSNGPIRMIDNTFYFPGWKVYIDDVLTEIEWQDVNYRGVITYQVPAGQHKIQVIFERTKVRKMADLISLVSMLMWAGTATVMVGVSNQKRS